MWARGGGGAVTCVPGADRVILVQIVMRKHNLHFDLRSCSPLLLTFSITTTSTALRHSQTTRRDSGFRKRAIAVLSRVYAAIYLNIAEGRRAWALCSGTYMYLPSPPCWCAPFFLGCLVPKVHLTTHLSQIVQGGQYKAPRRKTFNC